jgi:hypothetical protein
MPTRDFSFRVGNQYIANNPFFADNNQLDFYAYWRINENWGVSAYEHTSSFRRSGSISAT